MVQFGPDQLVQSARKECLLKALDDCGGRGNADAEPGRHGNEGICH